MNDTTNQYTDFLDPDICRNRLITASLYIAAFESLKMCIVDRIRDFFTNTFDETGGSPSPEYNIAVLERNKSPLYASLDWLQESGAINKEDIKVFERLKGCRNDLAHRLLRMMSSGDLPEMEVRFNELVSLLRKIEVWWIMNVELSVNLDFDGVDVDEDEVLPGSVMCLSMLADIALGDEESAGQYYREFTKRKNQ